MRTHRHCARFSAFHPELAARMSSINEFELKNAAGETTTIPKANKTGRNKAFGAGFMYSTIDDILNACTPELSKNGIVVMQFPEFVDSRLAITTRICHKSGQWIENTLSVKPDKDTAQSVGSAITYLKRYSLVAILGLACGEEDDDGNAASGTPEPKTYPQKPVQKPVLQNTGMEELRQNETKFYEQLVVKWATHYKVDMKKEGNRLREGVEFLVKLAPPKQHAENSVKVMFRDKFGEYYFE